MKKLRFGIRGDWQVGIYYILCFTVHCGMKMRKFRLAKPPLPDTLHLSNAPQLLSNA